MAAEWKEVVETYAAWGRRGANVELEHFRRQPTLEDAISEAALARFRGKKLDHQRRVPVAVLERSRRVLLANAKRLAEANSFDELFAEVEERIAPIHGIGELTVYDTALRIGAYLGHSPAKVYLHAGTREGAKRLGLDVRGKTLDVATLPGALRRLAPHETEDVLCIFKNVFAQGPSKSSRRGCAAVLDERARTAC